MLSHKRIRGNQRGAVLVLVAILFLVLIGLIAFAIDINHLYVVDNELQNAADAGALAGAGVLYDDPDGLGPLLPGSEVYAGANQKAYDIARENLSDNVAVDIHWTSGNSGDVQRGHWSFATRTFTPNGSLLATSLDAKTEAELDADLNFINAVKVTVRREDTPAVVFFARALGHESFVMQADAVAYLGYSGGVESFVATAPIVICDETLTNANGEYQCNVGRMLDSGASCPPGDPTCETTINTAGWSDLKVLDENQCKGSASASDVKDLVCVQGANQVAIKKDDLLQATNGVQASSYSGGGSGGMLECWKSASNNGRKPYPMTLPVVACGSGRQVDNCVKVVGVVTVNMLFMSDSGSVKPSDAPTEMIDLDPEHDEFQDWTSTSAVCGPFNALIGQEQRLALTKLPGQALNDKWLIAERWDGDKSKKAYTADMARWDCFVEHFQLINTNNKMAPMAQKTLYFQPDCTEHEPTGGPGGPNYGVMSKTPVLVK